MSGDKHKNKRKYEKPKIKTENLELFTGGATCNGTFNGNRKSTQNPPDNCAADRLKT